MSADVSSQARDQQLLSGLRAGEPRAVERWYKRYQPRLKRWLSTRISDPADREEILQEVFVNALRQLPLFRGQAQVETWLISIARHEVADYYRRAYAKRALRSLPFSEVFSDDQDVDMAVFDSHELAERVRVALASLRPRQQELLLQKYLDKLSVQTLAERWGRSVKAIESELFRARQAFRVAYAAAWSGA